MEVGGQTKGPRILAQRYPEGKTPFGRGGGHYGAQDVIKDKI
jgi:hypothetical protein